MAFNRCASQDNPCHGCTERQPGTGCHDRCEKFQAWKEKQQKMKDTRKAQRTNTMSEAQKKALWRSGRYSRQNGPKAGRSKY